MDDASRRFAVYLCSSGVRRTLKQHDNNFQNRSLPGDSMHFRSPFIS